MRKKIKTIDTAKLFDRPNEVTKVKLNTSLSHANLNKHEKKIEEKKSENMF